MRAQSKKKQRDGDDGCTCGEEIRIPQNADAVSCDRLSVDEFGRQLQPMHLRISHLDPTHVSPVMAHRHRRDGQVRSNDLFFFSLHDFLLPIDDWMALIIIRHLVPSDADGDVGQIFFPDKRFAKESGRSTHIGKLISRREGRKWNVR